MNSEVSAYDQWHNDPDWMPRIDIDEYERLAGIGYRPEQIAMYYKIPTRDFLWYFHLVGSPLKYHYDRGQLVQQAKEGLSMSAAAMTGEGRPLDVRCRHDGRERHPGPAVRQVPQGDGLQELYQQDLLRR